MRPLSALLIRAGKRTRGVTNPQPQPPASQRAHGSAATDERRLQPPRLILRFALYTALGLAVAGATILLFVRSYATSQAEGSVRYHARFLADVMLSDRLREGDFLAPAERKRRAA